MNTQRSNHTYTPTLLAILCTLILSLGSCTHNNGNIGPLFGQWKVVSVEGDELPAYNGNMFWSFQSHTVEVKIINEYHTVTHGYGNWKMTDNQLLLDFPDPDWKSPQASLLPAQCSLDILKLNSKNAIFQLRTYGSPTITYTLQKW